MAEPGWLEFQPISNEFTMSQTVRKFHYVVDLLKMYHVGCHSQLARSSDASDVVRLSH